MLTKSDGTRRIKLAGVGCGLAAAVLGYLAVYLATAGTIRNSAGFGFLEAVGSELAVWQVVGWVYLNLHGVTTLVPGLLGSTSAVNFVESAEAFSPALYVVPVVCLLLAGAAAAVLSAGDSPARGAVAGAAVALGYLVVVLAGLLAFPAAFGDAAVRPDPVTTVLVAGLAAPGALGAVGGAAAAAIRA